MSKTLSLEGALHFTRPRSFATLVKPVGGRCNLHCRYCYYPRGGSETMSEPLLETYIQQYIRANESDSVTFCWHGGEPTLAGIDFYRRALDLQEKYRGNKTIHNSLQTNGTSLDAAWAQFFADHHFLIGLSIDGPKAIHNAYRSNFEAVWKTIQLFHEYDVTFNTLSVVHKGCEGRGLEIYQFLRDEVHSHYLQFLPIMNDARWQISSKGYGYFLTDIFHEWYHHDVGHCFVQQFEATLARWCGRPSGICSMDETCGQALTVESNGDVYPCDHYVAPENKLGNLQETDLITLYERLERYQFGSRKRTELPRPCRHCEFLFACHGGCPKQRWDILEDGSRQNYLCEGLKYYFSYVAPYLEQLKISLHL